MGLAELSASSFYQGLCQFICAQNHLESAILEGAPLSRKSLVHLSSLPHLFKLEFGLSSSMVMPATGTAGTASMLGQFPALRCLRINAERLADVSDFTVNLSRPVALNILAVGTTTEQIPQDIHQLFNIVSIKCDASGLVSIKLTGPISHLVVHNPPDAYIWNPLFTFPNIRFLKLCTRIPHKGFDNNLVKTIAETRPQIEHLILIDNGPSRKPAVTIKDFHSPHALNWKGSN